MVRVWYQGTSHVCFLEYTFLSRLGSINRWYCCQNMFFGHFAYDFKGTDRAFVFAVLVGIVWFGNGEDCDKNPVVGYDTK